MKHFAILIIAMLFACSLYCTPPNPYPNEIEGLKFYERYLNPLTPHKSDNAQVVQVFGSDQGLELKDWRIVALYSCPEDFLTCSHGPRNDLLAHAKEQVVFAAIQVSGGVHAQLRECL